MKFTTVLFTAAATIVSAQNFDGIPTCAQECLRAAITSAGCQLTDPACQCGPAVTVIQASATACLVKSGACKTEELTTAATRGNELCNQFRASGGSGSNATITAVGTGGSVPAPTSNGTALSTSARLTSTGAGDSTARPTGTGAGAGGASSSSSKAGAAPTLIAGLGSVMGLVGGVIAVL